MPSPPHRCPSCGSLLQASVTEGLCPSCLWLSLDDADEDVAGSAPASATTGLLGLPGHTVLAELARGGMGIVYRARQHAPAREVALKMLLPHQLAAAEMRERFRTEIRACAALDHPAILPVYEVGEQDGQPFFTMKLAGGGNLAERRDNYRGRWREAADLVATLADAVQFAHAHGVLHRDIKPGNVLFDEADRPYLSDFGLAKFTGEDSTAFTRSLTTLGTPHYLAPEVASGGAKHATTASDIYALGAVLYELLAGRPPFEADSIPAMLRKVAEEEPTPLRGPKAKFRGAQPSPTGPPMSARSDAQSRDFPAPPLDLEVVALKCLRKEPSARYASAAALAEDLRRWLRGEPLEARPVTRLARTATWARRNPALAALSVILVCVLLAGLASQAIANRRLRVALGQALLSEARLTRATGRAGQRFDALAIVRRAGETARGRWLYPALWRTEVAAALARPDARVLDHWPAATGHYEGGEEFSGDLTRYATGSPEGGCAVFETATRRRLRSFPGRPDNPARGFRFSPDGRSFAVGYNDGTAEVWSLVAGRELLRLEGIPGRPPLPEFLSDGSGFVVGLSGRGVFRYPMTAEPDRLGAPVRLVAEALLPAPVLPDPDGTRLIAAGRTDSIPGVWSTADGHRVATGPQIETGAESVAWSSDGARYLVGQGVKPYAVALVNATNGLVEVRFNDHELPPRRVAFRPDGRSLASVGFDGKLIWRSTEPRGWRLQLDASQRALRFSADGRRLGFAPADGQLGVLELSSPTVLGPWASVDQECDCASTMDIDPAGQLLVTASQTTLSLWETTKRTLADQFALPAGLNWANAFFAPDGESIVASSLGWGVWRIALDRTPTGTRFGKPTKLATSTGYVVQEFAPDGRSLVVGEPWFDGGNGGPGTRVWLWPDADPSRARLLAGGVPIAGLRMLADGRTAFSTHWSEPDLRLWDTATTNRPHGLGLKLPVTSEPSPDGRWLVTASTADTILWDTRDWHRAATWGGDAKVVVPTFNRDARIVAACDLQGRVTLRTVPGGEELLTLTPTTPLRIRQMKFSADGAKLWLLHTTGRIWEWDFTALRRELAAFNLDWE